MKIRSHPRDFVVEEILREDVVQRLSPAPGARRYAVYKLTKASLTTEEGTRRLARAIGVSPGEIFAAGLKDKHASTTQHVSVGGRGATVPARAAGEGWEAELVGWSAEPAVAGWIRRNRFRLVVRDLTRGACARMDEGAVELSSGAGRLVVVNYFGDQRFGSARHGEGFAGARLVRGDFEGAVRLLIGTPARKDTGARREFTRVLVANWGRWDEALRALPRRPERRAVETLASGGDFRAAFAALPPMLQQMGVEAYQSHLWNAVARGLARDLSPAGEGIVAADPHGEMVFPSASRIGAGWRTLELPMLAASTSLTEPWRSVAAAVLAAEGLSLGDLCVPGLRRPAFGEAWRPFVVFAERFEMGTPEPDDSAGRGGRLRRTVGFELPRGAYATVVLRALGGARGGATPS